MNSAKPAPLPFTPTPDRLREIDARARRVAELDARERRLLDAWVRMGSAEVHSPYMGAVRWDFGPGGLAVNKDSTGEAG